jgi:excisionase family DNA binding protein
MSSELVYTHEAAAEYLNISRDWLLKSRRSGKITATKVGQRKYLYAKQELDRYKSIHDSVAPTKKVEFVHIGDLTATELAEESLYAIAKSRRKYPKGASREMFLVNAAILRNEGFASFEIICFASHNIDQENYRNMRSTRLEKYSEFASGFIQSNHTFIEMLNALDIMVRNTYQYYGWMTRDGLNPNPFKFLDTFSTKIERSK